MMLEKLTTEKRNEATLELDTMSIREIIETMNQEDEHVITAINQEMSAIEALISCVTDCFKKGGRLFYIGAGTSGRLGVLDAAECIPTFSVTAEMVQGIIAGGDKAMTVAVEGAEDSLTLAKEDLQSRQLTDKDFVLGITASGRTPYVIGGLTYAAEIGAKTGSLSCNKQSETSEYAEYPVEIDAGPEVLTGSTRLKAGTAQKLVLNMISTISMIKLGKVFKNLMVDVQPTNIKLVERGKHIVMEATGVSQEEATFYFEDSDRNAKLAIVRILTGKSKEEAQDLLAKNHGYIRDAVDESGESFNA